MNSPSAHPSLAPPRWRSVARTRTVLAVVLVELIVAALVAYGLWALRRQTLDGELRVLGSLSAAMATQADGVLDVADAVLRATRTELAEGLLRPGADAADALLRSRAAALPGFRALEVFDAEGRRIAGSRQGPAAGAEAFAAVRAQAEAGAAPVLVVGQPQAGSAGGDPAVTVAMDWRDAQGRFQGMVAVEAAPDFLDGGFARIAPTPDTSLAIYRRDRAPVSDGPGDGRDRLLPAPVLQALWADAELPLPRLVAMPDGSRRLLAAHRLQRHPLMVVVTRDATATTADWSDQAWLVGSFAASALAMTLFLTLRNAREQALRRASQAALAVEQEQLQHARKLQALGTLAGGVAHDFNNILAAVVGFGELARAGAAEGSGQARQLDQIMQAGLRGKALVERILSFSGGAPRPHTVLLLQPVVDEVLQLLAASLPARVELVAQLDAADATISGDATMVFEAVMNLCTNAIQAMQGEGRLVVALGLIETQAPRVLYERRLAPGRYACLSVQDSGPGIAPEVRARLFEPFFTTKGPRQGTGLGLAVVHGAMHDMGGAIDVQSEPGHGARFLLYFPCAEGPPGMEPAEARDLPLGQGQTVLVVDDEPALVALAEELLAGLGYEPLGIGSSTRALAELRADPGRFDLVLTDEAMPGLTGTELAAAVRALRPGLPVVLASGYGGPQLGERAAAAGVAVLLRKPLRRAELAQALARALEPHGTGG